MQTQTRNNGRILIVDDEVRYCEKLARFLAACGYSVSTAATARDAIVVGAASAPDVVITDWLLDDKIHGLHVADTIRAVHPRTRTIVMTGFSSADLRLDAEASDVCAFIEKPFSPELLATAVALAIEAPPARPPYPVLPFVVTTADGRITRMSRAARELLAPINEEVEGVALPRLFHRSRPLDLDHAAARWVEALQPVGRRGVRCVARARRLADGSYFVILGDEKDASVLKVHSSIRTLLDTWDHVPPRWPLRGNGLVIDPDVSARSLVVCLFEALNAICHSVETLARGLELLTRDTDVRYVIVDADVAGDVAEFARLTAHRRPEAVLVGQGEAQAIERLGEAGLDRCITKPWSVSGFLDLLVDERANREAVLRRRSASNESEEPQTGWRMLS